MNGFFFHHHDFELNQVFQLGLQQAFETKIRSEVGEGIKVAQKRNPLSSLLTSHIPLEWRRYMFKGLDLRTPTYMEYGVELIDALIVEA